MSLRVRAVFLAAMLLPTTVQAQKFIGDEFLKQLLRLSMPDSAVCVDKLGKGPSCTYDGDAGQIIAGKTSDGSVSVSLIFPSVNQGAATLEGTLVKVAVGFGFPQDQVHTCIRTGVHDFAVRRHKPDYDAASDGGWGPGVAETISVKDYKLMCRAGKPDVNHIDILIAINNSL
jgi:hypothetical protein